MERFVHKKKNFEFDLLLYREPVKSIEILSDGVVLLALDNDTNRGALDILEFSD